MRNNFIKSSITLMTGSLFTSLLSLLVSPLMTRLYTEDDIGRYTLIITGIAMFGTIICGRYDLTIVYENEEKNIMKIIKLSIFITMIFSLLISILYTVYLTIFSDNSFDFFSTFLLLLILFIITGLTNILNSYNNRFREYKLITKVQILRESIKNLMIILFGFLSMGYVGLLVSQITSQFLGIRKQSQQLRKLKKEFKEVNFSDLKLIAMKHMDQLRYSVPGAFANSFAYSIINILIGNRFGLVALAYYSMSFRVLGMPLALLSVNVSKVFFEKASTEFNKNYNYRRTFLNTTLLVSIISVPMVIILIIFSPIFFEIMFGKGWSEAGYYVQILAPMFGIRLIVSSVSTSMLISGKQNLELILQMLFIFSSFFAYFFTKNNQDIYQFLYLITITHSLIYLLYYIIMYRNTIRKI